MIFLGKSLNLWKSVVIMSEIWNRLEERFLKDEKTSQLLLVGCTCGSGAKVRFMVKEGNRWHEEGCCDAFIGKNGLGKEKEGDMKTPMGIFGIRKAFGIKPNPGTSIDYLQVDEGTYACDEPGEWYNQIVDVRALGRVVSGECMLSEVPAYNYGLETTYNNENIYPLGSAIFVHCKGLKTYTAGCVALDESLMEKVLKSSDSGLKVCIFGTSD